MTYFKNINNFFQIKYLIKYLFEYRFLYNIKNKNINKQNNNLKFSFIKILDKLKK